MSRSGRQRAALAPSLFPFLAVLLCTIGALVLMLMLMVSGAQSSIQAVAQQAEEELEWQETKIQLVSADLKERIDHSRVELEKKRLVLQNLEQHIVELTRELDDLQQQTVLVDQSQQTQQQTVSQRQQRISQLEQQLAEATRELEQKLEKPAGDKPIFAIIPYDGPNGTHRRPVYLECTDRGVIIQPEGVVVSPVDLKPPYGPGNPLDAALRTIRAEYPATNGAVTSHPYPLLVVRPSGIRHYMMARAAMSGWDDQFGYELVSEDLPLRFPPGPPRLKDKIVAAIEVARQRQLALAMSMPQYYDASSLDFSGQFTGGTADGGSGPSGSGSSSSSLFGTGSNQFATNGRAVDADAENTNPLSSRRTGGFDSGAMAAPASGRSAAPSSSGSSSGDDWSDTQGSISTTKSSTPPSASGVGGQPLGAAGGGTGSSANSQTATGAASGSALQQTSPISAGSQSAGSQSAGTQSAGAQSAGRQAGGGQSAGSQAGSGDPDAAASGMASPSLNIDLSPKSSENARPIAQSRGSNWAWRGPAKTQTAVIRAIRVQCLLDRWIVMPDAGTNLPAETIMLDGTPEQRVEKLVAILEKRVAGWGVALASGYWTPVLQVDVAPDAQWRFDQLSRLMQGSGIDVVLRGQLPAPDKVMRP
ncbi:MAG: hypothetical protein KF752_15185 [Pirellulaceae bacterium]|nr:hypothetical protein [Pirellulaceae bacterium]